MKAWELVVLFALLAVAGWFTLINPTPHHEPPPWTRDFFR